MSASELRFCVAGLEVLLRSARPDGLATLAGHYREYPPAGGSPGLVIDVERVPGLGAGRARGPEYPAFRRRLVGPGAIALDRFDADGRVDVPVDGPAATDGPPEPVRAVFRVGDSPNTLEAAVRIGASIALPRVGALILHASAIEAGGRACVFAGVSGAGKSTIAAMLADALPHARKLSDELLILAPAPGCPDGHPDGALAVHVAPFLGGAGLPHRAQVLAAGLHFLVQAPHHRRAPMTAAAGTRELLRHVLAYVAEPATASRVLAAAARAAAEIPCFRLEFARDPGVAGVLGIT